MDEYSKKNRSSKEITLRVILIRIGFDASLPIDGQSEGFIECCVLTSESKDDPCWLSGSEGGIGLDTKITIE